MNRGISLAAGLAFIGAGLLSGCGGEDRGPTDDRPLENLGFNADGSVDADFRGLSGGRVIVKFMCRDSDTANVYVDDPGREPYSQDSVEEAVCEDEEITTRDEVEELEPVIG